MPIATQRDAFCLFCIVRAYRVNGLTELLEIGHLTNESRVAFGTFDRSFESPRLPRDRQLELSAETK
jgi:hypothetical protein